MLTSMLVILPSPILERRRAIPFDRIEKELLFGSGILRKGR